MLMNRSMSSHETKTVPTVPGSVGHYSSFIPFPVSVPRSDYLPSSKVELCIKMKDGEILWIIDPSAIFNMASEGVKTWQALYSTVSIAYICKKAGATRPEEIDCCKTIREGRAIPITKKQEIIDLLDSAAEINSGSLKDAGITIQ
jgi:hypothetical protein